jgi:23S rRNA (uracil-5-)-methyltransferase RumA
MSPQRHAPAPVRRGDHVTLAIEALADGPDALARIDGYVVLVPGVLPGERVRAEITSAARKFGRARVLQVDRRAAERTEPRCRHFLQCGGCHWQHADYASQLRFKQQRVQKELAFALGEQAPAVADCVPAPAPYGQRHKVALQLLPGERGPRMALHRLRDLSLVPLQECPAVAAPALQLARAAIAVLGALRLPVFDAETGDGMLRSVLVRRAAATGQSHLVVVATDDLPELLPHCAALQEAGATTISVNVNREPTGRLLGARTTVLAGPPRIDERIGDTTYCIAPDAFFQTSPAGAGELVRLVRDFLQPRATDTVADLYCGGGLFALPLAQRAATVVGVEESPVALADAEAGVRRNRLHNVRLVRGAVEQVLERFGSGDLPRPDLAVLDPPRAGAAPAAVRRLSALGPRRIAHVACDPGALGRDLRAFAECGYRAERVVPVDMFPQTWHVEAVALLARAPA